MGLSLLSPAQVHVHTHKTNTDMHRERGKKNPTKPSLARIVLIKKKKKINKDNKKTTHISLNQTRDSPLE